MPGNLGGLVSFSTFPEWRSFVLALGTRRVIPEIVARKFERAQKLHVLAWLDVDLIKAGELIAMTALELALTDRYAGAETQRRRKLVGSKAETEKRKISKSEKWWTEYVSFADLLKHMVEHDGLTEEQIPLNERCGAPSKVIGRLTGEVRPSLSDLRNESAHGAPFDGLPQAGLLELVRDLIDYAYRDWPLRPNFALEVTSNINRVCPVQKIDRAKTRCDAPYGRAASRFLRFFRLCAAVGRESFRTVCLRFAQRETQPARSGILVGLEPDNSHMQPRL